jgi:hypothetical protein
MLLRCAHSVDIALPRAVVENFRSRFALANRTLAGMRTQAYTLYSAKMALSNAQIEALIQDVSLKPSRLNVPFQVSASYGATAARTVTGGWHIPVDILLYFILFLASVSTGTYYLIPFLWRLLGLLFSASLKQPFFVSLGLLLVYHFFRKLVQWADRNDIARYKVVLPFLVLTFITLPIFWLGQLDFPTADAKPPWIHYNYTCFNGYPGIAGNCRPHGAYDRPLTFPFVTFEPKPVMYFGGNTTQQFPLYENERLLKTPKHPLLQDSVCDLVLLGPYVPNGYPTVAAKNPTNEFNAFVTRYTVQNPSEHFGIKPHFALTTSVDRLLRLIQQPTEVTKKDWLQAQAPRGWQRASRVLNNGFKYEYPYSLRKLFIKSEKLMNVIDGHFEPTNARVISAAQTENNCILGPYIMMVTDLIKTAKRALNEEFVYCPGYSLQQMGQMVHDIIDDGFTHFLCIDKSKFDLSVTPEALEFEHSLYRRLLPPKPEVDQMLRAQIQKPAMGQFFLCPNLHGRRNSGDPNTTLGNTLLCALTARQTLDDMMHCNSTTTHVIFAYGDDMVIFSKETWTIESMQDFCDRQLTNYGFINSLYYTTDPAQIDFISCRLFPVQRQLTQQHRLMPQVNDTEDPEWCETFLFIPTYGKCIPKLFWSTASTAKTKAVEHAYQLVSQMVHMMPTDFIYALGHAVIDKLPKLPNMTNPFTTVLNYVTTDNNWFYRTYTGITTIYRKSIRAGAFELARYGCTEDQLIDIVKSYGHDVTKRVAPLDLPTSMIQRDVNGHETVKIRQPDTLHPCYHPAPKYVTPEVDLLAPWYGGPDYADDKTNSCHQPASFFRTQKPAPPSTFYGSKPTGTFGSEQTSACDIQNKETCLKYRGPPCNVDQNQQ